MAQQLAKSDALRMKIEQRMDRLRRSVAGRKSLSDRCADGRLQPPVRFSEPGDAGAPVPKTPASRISEVSGRWDAGAAMQRTEEASMTSKRTRELDYRSNDGLEVALLWRPETNRISVTVFDAKTGDDFDLDVDPADATDAFHHPYAYAASRGLHFVAGTRTPTEAIPV